MSEAVATAREALISQLIGELDDLVHRVESVEPRLAQACASLAVALTELQDGETRFRGAASAFVDQARAEVTRIVTIRTSDLLSDELQGHERRIRDAAALAMRDTIDDVLKPALLEHAKRLNAQRVGAARAPAWYLCFGGCLGAALTVGVALALGLVR